MITKQISRQQTRQLIEKSEWYRSQLGEPLAAIVESDTGVLTTRMPEHQRPIALRYREVVRQLAGC